MAGSKHSSVFTSAQPTHVLQPCKMIMLRLCHLLKAAASHRATLLWPTASALAVMLARTKCSCFNSWVSVHPSWWILKLAGIHQWQPGFLVEDWSGADWFNQWQNKLLTTCSAIFLLKLELIKRWWKNGSSFCHCSCSKYDIWPQMAIQAMLWSYYFYSRSWRKPEAAIILEFIALALKNRESSVRLNNDRYPLLSGHASTEVSVAHGSKMRTQSTLANGQ